MGDMGIRKQGFLRRLKTLKRRYFVLHSVSSQGKARLEYYENDKKFRSNVPPKRVIELASCFSIARKEDTKQKFAFVLYTREDVFGLVADTNDELTSWLDALLEEKEKSEEALETDSQHRWNVIIKSRGLGTSKNLAGTCELQLTNQVLCLFGKPEGNTTDVQLTSIRRCGHTDCFFFMELGRSAVTGAGELWIQVDDPLLAQNMHEAILGSMHTLSAGSETTRKRPQTQTIKSRPTSLLFSAPVHTRSDTSPDSPPLPRACMNSGSRDRHPSESDSPKVAKPAMLTRLLSGGRKKDKMEEMAHSVPKGRQFQSKSLSVEPGGSLLSRTQSADFSRMLHHLELQSPGSPDSLKEIDFEIIEPVRTMSNSSGSSGYSSGRSWETQVKPACATSESDYQAEYVNFPPSLVNDVTENHYMTMDTLEHPTLKEPIDETEEGETNTNTAMKSENETIATNDDESHDNVTLTQRHRTGYEDMSDHVEALNQSKDRNTPDTPKSSPKQKRTSQEGPAKEIRELVNLRGSASSPNLNIPRQKNEAPKGSPNTSNRRRHEDYMVMNPFSDFGTYVNFRPGEPLVNRTDEPQYVNVGSSSESKETLEEPHYMNFKPGETNIVPSEESNYMNVKAGGVVGSPEVAMPNYMNFCPISSSPEMPKSPKPKLKHRYENVTMEGKVKTEDAPEEPEYMNISPKNKGVKHGQTLPSRKSTGGIPRPRLELHRRRESEPAKGLSDEDAGMLFLDFSKKNKKEDNLAPLNYISLDLSRNNKSAPSRSSRPATLNLSHSRLHKHHSDLGPKSAPPATTYSEIDFTKSQGLMQARLEKEKPKS